MTTQRPKKRNAKRDSVEEQEEPFVFSNKGAIIIAILSIRYVALPVIGFALLLMVGFVYVGMGLVPLLPQPLPGLIFWFGIFIPLVVLHSYVEYNRTHKSSEN